MSKLKIALDQLGDKVPMQMVAALNAGYDEYIANGLSEKVASYKAIADYHRRLFSELNIVKCALKIAPDEFPADDKLQKKLLIDTKYKEKIKTISESKNLNMKPTRTLADISESSKNTNETYYDKSRGNNFVKGPSNIPITSLIELWKSSGTHDEYVRKITDKFGTPSKEEMETIQKFWDEDADWILESKVKSGDLSIGSTYNLVVSMPNGKSKMPEMIYEGRNEKGFHKFKAADGQSRGLTSQTLSKANIYENKSLKK